MRCVQEVFSLKLTGKVVDRPWEFVGDSPIRSLLPM
jgi:hypothetical protein